jgi:hypothetical protein
LVPVDTGISEIRVRFIETPDRFWGDMLSTSTLLLLITWFVFRRRAQLITSFARATRA